MKMAHVRRTVGSIYKNAQISQAVHVKSHLSYLQKYINFFLNILHLERFSLFNLIVLGNGYR